MKKELDKNSNLWYTVVTPIKKGTKICSRKTSSKPPPSSSILDVSAVQDVSSYLTKKQVSLPIVLTLGGSWNTTLTEFLTNHKQQKGNNKTCSNKSSKTSPGGCIASPMCSTPSPPATWRNGTRKATLTLTRASISQR